MRTTMPRLIVCVASAAVSIATASTALADTCASLPNPVYVAGSSAVKPFLAKVAAELASLAQPITPRPPTCTSPSSRWRLLTRRGHSQLYARKSTSSTPPSLAPSSRWRFASGLRLRYHERRTSCPDLWRFGIGEQVSAEVYLDVQTATNRANPEEIVYDQKYVRKSYITGLPVLPVLGGKMTW